MQEPWGLSLILHSSTGLVQERPVITMWRLSVHCWPEKCHGNFTLGDEGTRGDGNRVFSV